MSGGIGLVIGLVIGILAIMIFSKGGSGDRYSDNVPPSSKPQNRFFNSFKDNETQKVFQRNDAELKSILEAIASGDTVTLNDKTFSISENATYKVEYEQESRGEELEIKIRW